LSGGIVFVMRSSATPNGRVFPIYGEQCFARSVFFVAGSASLGTALTAVDITHDGFQDIVVGSRFESGGRVDVLPSLTGVGLSPTSVYSFRQPTIL